MKNRAEQTVGCTRAACARRIALCAMLAAAAGLALDSHLDRAERIAGLQRLADLACLAENIYYEARGEPLVGQYAVAEVTLNRVASRDFPDTVCAVVHARRWNTTLDRFVGAFSWTVDDTLPAPSGLAWQRARAIASTVYDNNEAPLVDGALFYHAVYVVPTWARTRTQVVRINQHIFYL